MRSIEHARSSRAIAWVVVSGLAAPPALLGACAATAPPPSEPPVVVVPAPPLVASSDRAPAAPPRGDEPQGEAVDPDRAPPEPLDAPDAPGDGDVHRFSFSGTLTADDDAGVRFSFQASGDAGLRFRASFGPDGGVFSFGDEAGDAADASTPPKTAAPRRAR